MIVGVALLAFIAAATLLTITPGLDTALVLRTASIDGPRSAMLAATGIAAGCLCWGGVVAGGLGVVLAASHLAYDVLRWVGAAYLCFLAVKLWTQPPTAFDPGSPSVRPVTGARAFGRGFLTNLLNPKVGLFYVSFLPQFIPAGANVPAMTALLAAIHAVLGLLWFAVLIIATRPIVRILRAPRVSLWLDRVTGGIFLAFGVKLALSRAR